MRSVLVINSGSSSLKYELVDPDSGSSLADGIVERIGEDGSAIADHEVALRAAFQSLDEAGIDLRAVGLAAVGHRVVHGGWSLHMPTLITDELIVKLEELAPLAPLHNPPAVLGIEVARKILPDLPHIAVFDTGFFHDLPPAAATYAIDIELAGARHIRRYGFHGTSHEYVSEQAAAFVGASPKALNQIVLHLGNGASASAIAAGRAVDTSMGFTPLEGLVMGTRGGDIDPGVISYLAHAGMTIEEIDSVLNRRSGVYGLAGSVDFRELRSRIESGDPTAQLAYDVYIHRLRKYIGAYLAILGSADVLSFTAGVGENDHRVRRDALFGMDSFGIELDEGLNASTENDGARRISTDESAVTVLVVPTNEELAIARACATFIDGRCR